MNEPIHSLTLMLVRGLAFLIIGLIVYAFLRKRSATAQNDFWRFVHVALVTVPLLGLLPSVWNLSLGPDLPPPITDTDSNLVESAQSTELPPLIVNEPEEAEIRTAGHFGFGWEINLALLWAIGATSILMRFAVGYLKLHKLRRGCSPISEHSTWHDEIRKERGRSINIYTGDHVPVPLIYGTFRPCLLLPTTILEASAEERAMIVRHEMAHAKRGDGLFNVIRVIATALHWPNPLAWFAAKRLRLTEEQAVDDTVLASGCRPVLYAELLTTVATGAAFSLPAQAMAQPSTLRTRVAHVLSNTRDRRSPSPLFRIALSLVLVMSLALLGSLGAKQSKEGWQTKTYSIDPDRWSEAIAGLESSSNPAKALLERAGIPLTDDASANYHKARKHLVTNAPREVSDKITTFLEEKLQIVSPTSVSVRLDCRWISLPINGEYPWLGPNVVHKGMSLAGVLTQPQIDVVLKGLRADPAVDMLAKPSAIVRSGESAAINVTNDSGAFHLSALATVASDAYTIDLELSFDPPSTERKARTEVSIYDGTSVVFSSQADETKFQLAIVTAQIIKDDGAPARALHPPRQKKAHTVVLDPGHGGQDRGGVVDEVEEKQLTLDFTRQVRRAFEDRGYQVVLTRQTDTFAPLSERSDVANDIDNALFVSLHFNSSKEVLMRGFETYYPMSKTNQASESMARFVQDAIQERIGDATPNRGIRRANFKVLQNTRHPAIMVEAAFLTNPRDLALVQTPAFLEKLTQGIVRGVEAFDSSR